MKPENPADPTESVLDDEAADADESLGFFPSWRSLYATVVVYTILLVIVLYLLTRVLDNSIP